VALSGCAAAHPISVAAVHREAPTVHRPGALRVPILLYHHVGPVSGSWKDLFVTLPTFARQMAAIAHAGVRTLTIDELYDAVRTGGSYPGGAVAITFDDGTEDQYLYAWPVLRQYGLRTTFYIATGLIGRPGYMTWMQLRELVASGIVAVEAHTVSHADLTRIDRADATQEIVESRRVLEDALGIAVRDFAYPFGAHDAWIEQAVRAAGFVDAVTTRYQWGRTLDGAMTWGRMEVHDTNSPENLASLASMSGRWAP
jgi:peptidoglycan/xylan/chitin deacetylase (PgdA/CDA1 family)